MRIIDLSLPIGNDMRGVAITTARRLEDDGWNATTLELYSHCGTHIDAPRHFLPDGYTLDQQPLETVVGPATVIDLSPAQPKQLITVEHLAPLADDIQAGARLLFRTDWHKRFGTPEYRNELPRISVELAEWLVAKQVALVGVEPPSVADVNNMAELTAVHQVLFRGNVVVVEGLAHLDQITSPNIVFIGIPLKISGGDASPIRAIALQDIVLSTPLSEDFRHPREKLMSTYQIVLLPGDGIGPECMTATRIVLDKLNVLKTGLNLAFKSHRAGAELYRECGEVLPDAVMNDCLKADAVLLSAIGLPDVRQADGTEVQPKMMVGLRRGMGLHTAVRPVKLFPGVPCPLKETGPGIDMVVIRENLEGLFASFGGGSVVQDDVATDTLVVTRKGTRQVVDYACRLAARRNGRPGDGKKMVTCVDKANVFRSFALFRRVFFEVAESHPEIEADAVYVDAMSLYMVQRPWDFDVLVMENQFGDILSDLGAGIVGGLGLCPSGEIGEQHALFQPSHGTAPSIAGRNIANPLATILSAAMMLDWLGFKHNDQVCAKAAICIEQAVARVLSEGDVRTPDIGGSSTTADLAQAVADALAPERAKV